MRRIRTVKPAVHSVIPSPDDLAERLVEGANMDDDVALVVADLYEVGILVLDSYQSSRRLGLALPSRVHELVSNLSEYFAQDDAVKAHNAFR